MALLGSRTVKALSQEIGLLLKKINFLRLLIMQEKINTKDLR